MKPLTWVVFMLVFFIPLVSEAVDTDATAIDTLAVDLWPDYDRASVLVLLTGTLPGNSPLPARVTLPLPDSARVNAVARIDSRDGVMKDDILSSPGLGELTLITPDPSFRVEYYMPYAIKDKQRAFDFSWQANLSVAKFRVKVQQPAAATSFRTVPATADVVRDENGMTYHTFVVRSLSAGQPFNLHVAYEMALPQLSARALPPPNPGPAPSTAPTPTSVNPGTNWPLMAIIAGAVLVVLAAIWMVVNQRR